MPITIDSTTVLRARAYDTTPIIPPGSPGGSALTHWSGPIQVSYLVGPIADATNFVIAEVRIPKQTEHESNHH